MVGVDSEHPRFGRDLLGKGLEEGKMEKRSWALLGTLNNNRPRSKKSLEQGGRGKKYKGAPAHAEGRNRRTRRQ